VWKELFLVDLSVFALRVTDGEGVVRIDVRGELDHLTHHQLVEAVEASCSGCDELVIDLTGVTFIDGGGLAGLARAAGLCEAATVDLVVNGQPPLLTRMLEATGIELPLEHQT
jgi:anti-anti-sigma factor